MIVVGGSLGGMHALQKLLSLLDVSVPRGIVVALHRHRDSDPSLVQALQRTTRLRVTEAIDKTPIVPGSVYLGPADYHVMVDGERVALSVDDPVKFARPSIDVLFESASTHGPHAVAIALTGGGSDGAAGAAVIEANGGRVMVQTPDDAFCADLPRAVIAATRRREILSIEQIAARLMEADR